MSKKVLLHILALLFVLTISLPGCSKQATLPQEDSIRKAQEAAEDKDKNENEAEEQGKQKEEEKAEENTEERPALTEEASEGEQNDANMKESELEQNDEDEKESDEENQENVAYVSATKLNIRADNNAQSKLLGGVTKGKEVKVLEEVREGEEIWYKIQVKTIEGYMEGWVLAQYTVEHWSDLLSSPTLFENQEMNDYFTSPTLLEDNTVIAYYGHPNSKIMGIVGRHSKKELIPLLQKTSETYDSVNGDNGVIPAIYLVYGTVQPGGEIGIMNYDLVMSYIEEAYKNGILVYLDHQMGKHYPTDALQEILPFLKYPNVHLALDPEWRTNRPMKEVGHLTGTELNEIQQTMRDYIVANEIPGKRQFVFHQFIEEMVRDIEAVSVDYDPVLLVHNTSGWGPPEGKTATHTRNAKATNIPYKGFKLWYFYSDKPGVHYDNPIMTPEQVLDLNPEPQLIIYQ